MFYKKENYGDCSYFFNARLVCCLLSVSDFHVSLALENIAKNFNGSCLRTFVNFLW